MRRRSLLATTTLFLLTAIIGSASAETLDPERIGEPEKAWYDTGFEDVAGSHVFAADIAWLAATGISTGYADEDGYVEFRPSQPVLREQMAAFLYRYASEDRVDDDGASFSDVAASHAFFNHVEWLAGTGISTGYSDGTFRGSQPVLREQMAAFLWRYAGSPEVPSLPSTSPFTDVPRSHTFYEAIVWLAAQGISTGYDDKTFRPSQPVLREQMAAFLSRMDLAPFGPYQRLLDDWIQPVMSGDGEWLAFESYGDPLGNGSTDRRVYAGNTMTGELRQLDAPVQGQTQSGHQSVFASITDDGRYIAFSSNFSNIVAGDGGSNAYLHDTVSGTTTVVPRPAESGPSAVSRAAISADGSTVALVVQVSTGPSTTATKILRVDRASGEHETIAVPGAQSVPQFIDISADGDRILLWTVGPAYLWDRGENDLSTVTPSYGLPDLSPDGRWIANGSEVFEIGTDTVFSFQDLAPGIVVGEASYAFSGDSSRLVLAGNDGGSPGVVVRVSLATQEAESIVETFDGASLDGRVTAVTASRDASLIAFSSAARNLMPVHLPGSRAVYLWSDPTIAD